jgi:hypothetical protein
MVIEVQAGGVYSVVRLRSFGVVRVLAYEPQLNAVFARVYNARFEERKRGDEIGEPSRDPALMLEKLGMGIGVLPVTRRVFEHWEPVFMFAKELNDEERRNLEQSGGTEEVSPWDDLIYP